MKKMLLIPMVLVLVSGLIFGGCAAPAAPAPPTEPEPPAGPAAPITGAPSPIVEPAPAPEAPAPVHAAEKYGGVLNVAFKHRPLNYGFPLNVFGGMHHYARMAMQHLVKSDPKSPGRYLPLLAESWELAPDRTSYVFYLRKGVTFHDGTDFNAKAVKWNYDQVRESTQPYLREVESIDVVDDYTLRFNLSSWNALIMSDLEREPCFITSPTACEKFDEEWMNNHPVGTGAWKVKDWAQASYVKWERFEDYWEEGLPYLDGVVFHVIEDPMTAKACLLRGDVQAMFQTDRVNATELRNRGYEVQTFIGQIAEISYDTTSPESIWYDKRMREALEYAVDKEMITQALGEGWVKTHYEIIHSIHDFGDPGTIPRKYDPEKARQLLAEAGYPQGVKTSMMYATMVDSDFVVALQGSLSEVGIELQLDVRDPAVMQEVEFSPHEGNELRLNALRYDPPNLLGAVRMGLSEAWPAMPDTKRTEGFEARFVQAMNEADPDKQLELLMEMEKLAYEDVMLVPLWNNPMFCVYTPKLRDSNWYPTGPFQELQYAWFEE